MNIEMIRTYVETKLGDDRTDHDLIHLKRVGQNAEQIIRMEQAKEEAEIIQVAVLLHEMLDDKLFSNIEQAELQIIQLLKDAQASDEEYEEVMFIIKNQSYSKNIEQRIPLSLAGQIVQDADRLDALGAIGVMRTAYYGGARGHVLYNDGLPITADNLNHENYRESKNVINHFYEKLFKLKDLMNTKAGRQLAEKRHAFMVKFIQQLKIEIEE